MSIQTFEIKIENLPSQAKKAMSFQAAAKSHPWSPETTVSLS